MSLGFMKHYDTSLYDIDEFLEIWPEISEIGIEVLEMLIEDMAEDTMLIPGANSNDMSYLKGCLFILGFSNVDKGLDISSYDGYTSDAVLKTKTVMNEMGIKIDVIDNVSREFVLKLKLLFQTSGDQNIERLWQSLKVNRDRTPEVVKSQEVSADAGKNVTNQGSTDRIEGAQNVELAKNSKVPDPSVAKGAGAIAGVNFPSDPSKAKLSVQYSLEKDGESNLSPNFKVKDFRSKDGSDLILINPHLVELLDKIQSHFGKKIRITSGYRTPKYNKTLEKPGGRGAVKNSQHMYGNAADIQIPGITPSEIYNWMKDWHKGGLGVYPSFVHVDVRDLIGDKMFARWDKRSPQKQTLA